MINYTIYENKIPINGSLLSMEQEEALLFGLNKFEISKIQCIVIGFTRSW
jgi:hypothetical protein